MPTILTSSHIARIATERSMPYIGRVLARRVVESNLIPKGSGESLLSTPTRSDRAGASRWR